MGMATNTNTHTTITHALGQLRSNGREIEGIHNYVIDEQASLTFNEARRLVDLVDNLSSATDALSDLLADVDGRLADEMGD